MSAGRKIAISGINATDNPGPGVAVARSLKEKDSNLDLIGLSYDVHDPGNYMTDIFSNAHLLSYPSQGWVPLKQSLKQVQEMSGLDVLIPCLDAELPLLIKHQADLDEMGILSFLPTEKQFELRSKDKLVALSKEIGCNYPRTVVVNSLDELASCVRSDLPPPCIVKGKYYKAYVVYNLDTAMLKGTEIAAEWGYPLLVQEKVSGQEINLIGLADGKGNLLGRVTIKKQLTTALGKVWTAVTIHDQLMDELATRFCAATQWRGPFELECIRENNKLHLIEINPRFPAWVYFATAVGINLPSRLVDFMTHGRCDSSMDYPSGKFLVRQTSEFVTNLEYFQNLLIARNREGK